jgi:type I restriction enzyme S subunit
MEMPVFPNEQREVARTIEPLLQRQAIAEKESKTLATLRDTLLPKLISGELRVKDWERMGAAVL